MTSETRPATDACFVYLTLPGETTFVPCGRFAFDVDRHGVATGRFVYGKSYLARANAVPVDPLELKLAERVYETRSLKGVFGAIRDASPDYWGRRVIEKYAGLGALCELDYLLHSPDDRAGALAFGLKVDPPAPRRAFNRTLDLVRLQALADAIIAEEDVPPTADAVQAETLLLAGTSLGGARPKAVVEDREALWIAKFNRSDDRWNNARVEHAMLLLARECGLHTAESRLERIGTRDALLVKRFDRHYSPEGYHRARMLSALTLLRAGDTHQDRDRWSYVLLAEELRRVCAKPQEEAPELFRRMCFNALISNTDDHPRNHAVIARDMDWKLSPAYDLTPTALVSIERRDLAMACGDYGRYAHVQNLLSQSARFLLTSAQAKAIVDDMETLVKNRWYAVARSVGVSEADCDKIAGAFAYEGFRLKLPSS
jgi:serine/threonine-protein kinase HipA